MPNISAPIIPSAAPIPVPSLYSHSSIGFQKVQKRYAQRPINQFPWKEFHLNMSSQGYVVGSDWAMTTFDNRTDGQFFDSKRLQTIDEDAEVQIFYPFDPLNYSRDPADLDVLQELRHLEVQKRESYTKRLYIGTKYVLAQAELKIRNLYCSLSGCIHIK